MTNFMTKTQFLKRSLVAVALSTALFGSAAYAAIKPFESEKTQQIQGFQPIIPSIGAAIVKKGQTEPYAAVSNGNIKTTVNVGDKLYVPVGILQSVREQYAAALKDQGIFEFKDLDGDEQHEGGKYIKETPLTPKSEAMDVRVQWYVMPKDATKLEEGKMVQEDVSAEDFGVPYLVTIGDAGKKIGFRVTPVTVRGIPDIGQPLDVLDVSKLAGQKYPEVPEEPGVIDPTQPPVLIPDNELPNVDNPNIDGGGIVQNPYAKYRVVIVNSDGIEMSQGDSAPIAYVNSKYTVKIQKIEQDANGKIVEKIPDVEASYVDLSAAELADLENNIVWQLYDGDTLVVNTGLSANAAGDATDLAALKAEGGFDPVIPQGDISGRLEDGTLTFVTQLDNSKALVQGTEGSEQGLTLKAILVADDELDPGTQPETPPVAE